MMDLDLTSFDNLRERAYKHGLKLFRNHRHTTDVEEEARDHASEVVSKFWRTCENKEVSIHEQPLSLFYKISTNRYIDWYRKQQSIEKKLDGYQRERETDPETHDPNSEVSQILDKAIAMAPLAGREKQVMTLAQIGRTESEIVTFTGLTKNQVKYAKHRAFLILRRDPALVEYMES